MDEFIKNLPKAELHVHIEGTMEPEQLLFFADRNNIKLPYKNIEQAQKAYRFSDYQSFIDAYRYVTEVLQHEQDFYELTLAYLKKVAGQGVLHTEIFFDTQTYARRNISASIIINGIHRALVDGKKQFGISAFLIMCFIRDFSEQDALRALEESLAYKDKIIGIGLASVEQGNGASKFERAFASAREYGYHVVAHAGEVSHENNSGSTMVRETVERLHVERIDHGTGCISDASLVSELAQRQIPFTVCPLSNIVMGNYKTLEEHPLKKMIDAGLMVTINSDDPAFFGGYIADNYKAALVIGLTQDDLVTCARNSFKASFLDEKTKEKYIALLDQYVSSF